MTVSELITTLKTGNVLVSIINSDEKEIVKLYSSGIESLDDELEAREISKWWIISNTALKVMVKDKEVTPDPEPETPTDPDNTGD